MNLTGEQIQALREGEPVSIVPTEVGAECVLLRKDIYEKVIQTLDEDLPNSRSISRLIQAIDEENDLDFYQQYKR